MIILIESTSSWLSPIEIFTILISLSSLGFSYHVFRESKKKDKLSLKLEWYKIIILESRFDNFFRFFELSSTHLLPLKQLDYKHDNQQTLFATKQHSNQKVLDELNKLEYNLISLLLAVDSMLYSCVKKQFDDFVDELDLSDEEIYQTEITNFITKSRTDLLKIFVDFKGTKDSHLG